MHSLIVLRSLALLLLANGTPVAAKKILGRRLAQPLDAGVKLPDGRPLLGPSKTVRGVVLSLLVTAAGAPLLGVAPSLGALFAGAAMAGDLLSSFAKRRLDFRPSSRALGLDQVPESLLPLLACRSALGLTDVDVALAVSVFFLGEIALSRLLYWVHLRDEPY
ncbi:MAG TPA: hypothetical protein VE397_17260 [Stellaceae bacterium]|jgi:CDP-2,3-bis-(O-geranylgeranyl)-sn-glycerol synthase|nr:hypothetical protein [Stellaceae bacterium]